MPTAKKSVRRARTARKLGALQVPQTARLRMSPLGHKLVAAIIEHNAGVWLQPDGGSVSQELADDKRYQRAWSRRYGGTWCKVVELAEKAALSKPSLSNLVDRAIIVTWAPEGDPADFLPGGKPNFSKGERAMSAAAGILAMSDVPLAALEFGRPADAEERVKEMLGDYRPKRAPLSEEELSQISTAAAADAVAKAKAAAPADRGPAPLFG